MGMGMGRTEDVSQRNHIILTSIQSKMVSIRPNCFIKLYGKGIQTHNITLLQIMFMAGIIIIKKHIILIFSQKTNLLLRCVDTYMYMSWFQVGSRAL